MDNTRTADLEALKQRMEDDTLPMAKRRQAWATFQNIRKQMDDRKLAALRTCLVKAHRASDNEWVGKYQQQIKEHSYRMGYEKALSHEDTSD